MTRDVDEAASDLSVVQSGDGLESLPVTDVERTDAEVRLTLSLPSGTSFTETFSIPPVWGANCDLATLLDAVNLGPDELNRLEGKRLPCDRNVTESGIDFFVDMDAVAEKSTGSSAVSPGSDLDPADE